MFGFLGFILILFLLILFIGFAVIGNVLRLLFGWGKRGNQNRTYTNPKQQTYRSSERNQSDTYTRADEQASSRSHSGNTGDKKKIFDDDEGEYVDFEEVKDK